MPNLENKNIVEELKERVRRAKSITFADYRGLKSEDLNNLRGQFRLNNAEAVVAKNTLLKVALKAENVDTSKLEKDLKGPTTAVFSYGDAIAPIKLLVEFAKKMELPKIKSAVIEGQYAGIDKIEEVSKIPSREVLIARLLGSLQSPMRGIVTTFGGVQRKFVYAIAAIKNRKEGGANN